MYTIKYTKLFVNGILEGMTYDSELSYPSLEQATEVVGRMGSDKVVKAIGGSDYVCLCAQIVTKGE